MIFLTLPLTTACNNNCSYCQRPPIAKKNHSYHSMSFSEITHVLSDAKKFSKSYDEIEIKLTGGESTLWNEGSKDIKDVMFACIDHDLPFSLVSNGIYFSNKKKADFFFKHYFAKTNTKLSIFITVDSWHNNFNPTNNTCPALDNIISIEKILFPKQISLTVQSTFSKQNTPNLSYNFIEKYQQLGVNFMINPFLPWGMGRNMSDLSPTLDLSNVNKKTLGAYSPVLFMHGINNGYWESLEEYLNTTNTNTLIKHGSCGKTLAYFKGNYYYCIHNQGVDFFKISKLGQLTNKSYRKKIESNKLIKCMRKCSSDTMEKIVSEFPNDTEVSIAYGTCDVCKKFYDLPNFREASSRLE